MRGSFIAQKERARCFYQFLSNLLIFSMQGFIQALTDLRLPEIETQS